MYICYNSFFDEDSFRDNFEEDNFEEDYPDMVCPYYEAMLRQMPPPPPIPHFQGPGSNPQGMPTGHGNNAPAAPPPTFTPAKTQAQFQPKAISGQSIRPCTFRYVYIWLDNGRSFWAWLVRVDRRSASGWRWNGRRWLYFGIDLRRIDSFICH